MARREKVLYCKGGLLRDVIRKVLTGDVIAATRPVDNTDSAPSSTSKAQKPEAAKSRQDNAGSASTSMVPIGNGEQTPMGASSITPATGLAGAVASPKNTGVSPMRGVNLSPASPHITGQKLLACSAVCRFCWATAASYCGAYCCRDDIKC